MVRRAKPTERCTGSIGSADMTDNLRQLHGRPPCKSFLYLIHDISRPLKHLRFVSDSGNETASLPSHLRWWRGRRIKLSVNVTGMATGSQSHFHNLASLCGDRATSDRAHRPLHSGNCVMVGLTAPVLAPPTPPSALLGMTLISSSTLNLQVSYPGLKLLLEEV